MCGQQKLKAMMNHTEKNSQNLVSEVRSSNNYYVVRSQKIKGTEVFIALITPKEYLNRNQSTNNVITSVIRFPSIMYITGPCS